MSETETQGGNAGKVVVVGLLLLIVVGVGGIGYHHATRNRVRHEAGLNGGQLYAMYCARCHGEDRAGSGSYPSLLASQLEQADFTIRVQQGKDAMPAFPELTDAECRLLYAYVRDGS
jgi:cytochrome c1